MNETTITIIVVLALMGGSYVFGAFWQQKKVLKKIEKYFTKTEANDEERKETLQKAEKTQHQQKISKKDVASLLERIKKEIENANTKKELSNTNNHNNSSTDA